MQDQKQVLTIDIRNADQGELALWAEAILRAAHLLTQRGLTIQIKRKTSPPHTTLKRY